MRTYFRDAGDQVPLDRIADRESPEGEESHGIHDILPRRSEAEAALGTLAVHHDDSHLACLLALVLALPWVVELPPVQRLLANLASRVMAPGAVRFDHSPCTGTVQPRSPDWSSRRPGR